MRSHVSRILIKVTLFILVTSCTKQSIQPPILTFTPPDKYTISTTVPTIGKTPVNKLATRTPTIPIYQITYISEGQKIYGKIITCIENNRLCFGEENLLVSIQTQNTMPTIPIGDYSWSPDGKMIAICATGVSDQPDIFWTNINDLMWKNITNSNVYDCSPNWTRDGKRLIYDTNSYELYGGSQVFSSSLNGEDIMPILAKDKLGDEEQVSLSPDGNRLAFIHSDENGFYQIYITNLDGSNRIQITDLPAHNIYPSFSPDGKWIVFIRQTDPYDVTNQYDNSRNHIVIINIESKEEITIISGKNALDDFESPSWAPFGEWIAFSSDYEGNYDIYVISVDGKNLIKVNLSENFERNPKWKIVNNP